MDIFWKWLMRANARWVFQALCLALLAVSGWWAWRLSHDAPAARSARTGQIRLDPAPPLGLRTLFAANDDPQLGVPALSPLVLSGVPQPPEAGRTDPPAHTPATPDKPPTRANPPSRPHGPTVIAVTFRGVFEGPDATRRALLQTGAQAPARFVRVGEVAAPGGWLVRDIARDTLILARPDGEPVELTVGVPRNVEVPRDP